MLFLDRAAPTDSKAFTGIEIGRFLCAFAVMLWHYQHFFQTGVDAGSGPPVMNYPLYSVLRFFYTNGHYAVVIFWMISGFIFFWRYGASVHERKITGYRFFVLRFSRLYPLHLTSLIVVTLLQILYVLSHHESYIYGNNDPLHFILQLAFASNWLNWTPATFNGPIWSVSVEVLGYIFFFITVSLFNPGLILCLVVAIVFKILAQFQPSNVFVCIEYFFIGGLVVQIVQRLNRTSSRILFWLCVTGIVGICATHFGSGTVLIFAFCLLTTFVLLDQVFGPRFERISKLGDLTYASYLIHFPIQLVMVLVLDWLGVSRNVFFSPLALITWVVITFGLSWAVFVGFEMPVQNRIRSLALRARGNASSPDRSNTKRPAG